MLVSQTVVGEATWTDQQSQQLELRGQVGAGDASAMEMGKGRRGGQPGPLFQPEPPLVGKLGGNRMVSQALCCGSQRLSPRGRG